MGGRAVAIACAVLTGCVFEPPAAVLESSDDADAGRLEKDSSDPTADATSDSGQASDSGGASDSGTEDAEIDDATEASADAADAAVLDAGPPVPDIPHLAPEDRSLGTDPLTLVSQTIDTTNLTIELPVPLPPGVTFTAVPQSPAGPELAVLRVGSLEIAESAVVRVIGDRPLVVLSAGDIVIRGTLDLSANGATPGPGGYASLDGPGAGQDAINSGSYSDPGGGGGGYGTDGAPGGTGEAGALAGGVPGPAYGDDVISMLRGGSGGGRGRPGGCQRVAGGGGGGALQIYSLSRIRIEEDGVIDAGGGGGRGGPSCGATNAGAGAGGGSGGAILLQAPRIEQNGSIAANGGGGGGGASGGLLGDPGDDARTDEQAAEGGESVGTYGRSGGSGGFGTTEPMPGDAAPGTGAGGGNAGSGGGAVGRIYILTQESFTNDGVITPAPWTEIYP